MPQISFARERWFRNLERSVVSGRGILQEGEDFFFDGEFAFVGKFETVAGEDLDAIICPGIVRRGNHDSGRE
jgi:hypothetical protein